MNRENWSPAGWKHWFSSLHLLATFLLQLLGRPSLARLYFSADKRSQDVRKTTRIILSLTVKEPISWTLNPHKVNSSSPKPSPITQAPKQPQCPTVSYFSRPAAQMEQENTSTLPTSAHPTTAGNLCDNELSQSIREGQKPNIRANQSAAALPSAWTAPFQAPHLQETRNIPSLEVLKATLDGALGNLI